MKKNYFQSLLCLVALLAIVVLCGAARSCTCCTLQGCWGGFILFMSMEDEETLPDGTYDFYVEVEDISFQEQCIVKSDPPNVHCSANAIEQSADDDSGLWAQVHASSDEHTIQFNAEFHVAERGGSIAGPEHVTIRVELDGVVIGEGEWWPEYERDYEFWGDEDCGYCDLAVEEEMMLSSPE